MTQLMTTPWEYILIEAINLPHDHPCRNGVLNTLERAKAYADAVVSPKNKAKWHTTAVDAIDPLDVATEQWVIARLSEYRRRKVV